MEKEDKILLGNIRDKLDRCRNHNMVTYSNFLDLRQQSIVQAECSHLGALEYTLYGGYEDAERKIAIFLPDYGSLPEDSPLTVFRAIAEGGNLLSHRDYLGAMIGLGLKRDKIGDILTNDRGADIIILDEIGPFLIQNFMKAGRSAIKGEIVPFEQLMIPERRVICVSETVASLRLDNVISAAFRISRTKAVEHIHGGRVFVNGLEALKPDKQVVEKDKLVLRGKGKAILAEIGGATRKDRIYIQIERYI